MLEKNVHIFCSCIYQVLEKEMATHCGILAWRIPWTEESDRLQSGVARVGHDLATKLLLLKFTWEKEMATHSSILVWRIPWTEEPGRLQSTGSQRVGHN